MNVTLIDAYLSISKLNSILAVANLLVHIYNKLITYGYVIMGK